MRVLLTTIHRRDHTSAHASLAKRRDVLSATQFVRRGADGNVLWSDSFPPHSLENVGDSEPRVIMDEVKQRA